jgi:hypothetical protein
MISSDFLIELSLATLLGLVVGLVYARAYRGFVLSASFVHTCVIAVVLVSLAVSTVRDAGLEAAALGFALVGLLGLIRFRTVVRDTREFSFIFLAIVTGVLVGSGKLLEAIAGCGVSLAVLVSLERTGFGASSTLAFRVRVRGDQGCLEAYCRVLSSVAKRVHPVSIRVKSADTTIYIFELLASAGKDIDAVSEVLSQVPGTGKIVVSRIQRDKGNTADDE